MGRMESISDLFGKKYLLTPRGVASERAELLHYFLTYAENKKGKLQPARMGYLLSHLKVRDLYYMKSVLESETKRGANWNKVFWGMLKTK